MAKQLNLEDDQIPILLRVFEATGHPGDGLSEDEKLEFALAALINSFDSQQDAAEEQPDAGEAVDLDGLKKSLETTLNPDIAMDLVVQAVERVDPKEKTFDDFAAENPSNPIVVNAKKGDEFDQKSAVVVFNAFPKDQWNTELCTDMWRQGAITLRSKAVKDAVSTVQDFIKDGAAAEVKNVVDK